MVAVCHGDGQLGHGLVVKADVAGHPDQIIALECAHHEVVSASFDDAVSELFDVSRVDDEETEVLFTLPELAVKRDHGIDVGLLQTVQAHHRPRLTASPIERPAVLLRGDGVVHRGHRDGCLRAGWEPPEHVACPVCCDPTCTKFRTFQPRSDIRPRQRYR